jgi:transcriptional regulator with XRE-family HTH domain
MKTPIIRTRGATIRRHRYAQGMNGKQLAEKVGITASYLSGIERGRNPGGPETLAKIAAALGVDAAELIEEVPTAA